MESYDYFVLNVQLNKLSILGTLLFIILKVNKNQ